MKLQPWGLLKIHKASPSSVLASFILTQGGCKLIDKNSIVIKTLKNTAPGHVNKLLIKPNAQLLPTGP